MIAFNNINYILFAFLGVMCNSFDIFTNETFSISYISIIRVTILLVNLILNKDIHLINGVGIIDSLFLYLINISLYFF